ncbi:(Fe-S)-binding protein [Magnetovibrio sp. PR-2]|uniref:(Fe-S)-binding protein n=1 Tax=Magnetovibrio sp. PR-2 TaxID=3120356 RepID=UPI002FCE3452
MKTFLDWSAYEDAGMGDAYADIPKHGGDFAKAVAACINSRQCEQLGKQVMCPSYKVSENPLLSTGGRVKLLKSALNAENVDTALADPDLIEAMELCVSCKGCKRECENNIDMPLIKAEYLAHKVARDGLSLRARLFAYAPHWLERHAWLKPWVRLKNQQAWLSRIALAVFGLADRPLPEPAAKAFSSPKPQMGLDDKPHVVLLADTFTRHFEPHIAQAAIDILRHGGYGFEVLEPLDIDLEPTRALCCGRTFLAQGLIDQARTEARRLFKALKPHIDAGRIVVGLEASCVLGLRDDAQALGLDDDVKVLGKSVLLFEEFLAKEIKAKRLDLDLADMPANALIHGHCHQKAVGAMKSVRRVLKTVPELDFDMIDASCCGMAGTFGLEAEHAEMSQQMANQALMPTLAQDPDAIVIANGFSCRQQIKALGDDRPRHIVEIIAERLAPKS